MGFDSECLSRKLQTRPQLTGLFQVAVNQFFGGDNLSNDEIDSDHPMEEPQASASSQSAAGTGSSRYLTHIPPPRTVQR